MSVDPPTPIAVYIDAENRGDTKALAQCFAEDAVVRDEGKTIQGLAAIKQWKSETKRKYQHTIEPLAAPGRSPCVTFSEHDRSRLAYSAAPLVNPFGARVR